MSYMGPGFLMLFPPGEPFLGAPMKIPLNLVNYVSTPLQSVQKVSFSLGVETKSEHSLQTINT